MKINGNEIKAGYVLQHHGALWVAVKTQHTQPGKGGAYIQVEMRNLLDGTKLNERFRSGEGVERVSLEEASCQYLFSDGDSFTLMDQETFEQINVPKDLVGPAAVFPQEGMEVTVCSHEGKVVRISLPETVVMEVVEADPVLKGQTASFLYKPARLENGVRITVLWEQKSLSIQRSKLIWNVRRKVSLSGAP